jgi:hypothetical protein
VEKVRPGPPGEFKNKKAEAVSEELNPDSAGDLVTVATLDSRVGSYSARPKTGNRLWLAF